MLFILNKSPLLRAFVAALTLVARPCWPVVAVESQQIGVYSGRHYNTDKELYNRFTEATGINVKLLEAKDDALIERLRSEGSNSPADVLILATGTSGSRRIDGPVPGDRLPQPGACRPQRPARQ